MKDYRKSIKLFSNSDDAWKFIWELDKREYEVLDYGTLDNLDETPYYALYRKKNNKNS